MRDVSCVTCRACDAARATDQSGHDLGDEISVAKEISVSKSSASFWGASMYPAAIVDLSSVNKLRISTLVAKNATRLS